MIAKKNKLFSIGKTIEALQKERDAMPNLGFLNKKKRKEMDLLIDSKIVLRDKNEREYREMPRQFGFKSLKDFNLQYQKCVDRIKEQKMQVDLKDEHERTQKKLSIHERLSETKKKSQDRTSVKKCEIGSITI